MKWNRVITTLTALPLLHFSGAPLPAETALPDWASTESADAAIKNQEWAKAEADLKKIVNIHKNREGFHISSQEFGEIYFKLAWCQMKQEKWKEAAKSFEISFKGFPPSTKEKPSKASVRYWRESLRYWGNCEFQLGKYEDAAKLYRKYIEELGKK